MKTMIYFSAVITAVLVLGKSITKKEKASDLLARNVEALASVKDDGTRYYCYGSGKVDCYDGTKVERQSTLWSLGDNHETE